MAAELVLSEMGEQSEVLRRIVERRPALRAQIREKLNSEQFAGGLRGICLLARGSSDNVAVHARYLLELATGHPVALIAPSLITRYGRTPDLRNYLMVAISQSGRTPEITDIAKLAAQAGAFVVSVTNEDTSPLADVATINLAVQAGPELAVPATKTVTGQLAMVVLLAEALEADLDQFTGGDAAWAALPDVVQQVLADTEGLQAAVDILQPRSAAVHLARGLSYAAALEGALKSKETARRVHEGYSSADFLHGPLTVAGPQVAVIAYGVPSPVLPDVIETVRAAVGLGAPVIGVGSPELTEGLADQGVSCAQLSIPSGLGEALAVIPMVVRGQQLAVATTLALGMNPDAPQGLNKVTATH